MRPDAAPWCEDAVRLWVAESQGDRHVSDGGANMLAGMFTAIHHFACGEVTG